MILQTDNTIYHLLRALRPRQWVKNASLFAAAMFSGRLFESDIFFRTVVAAIIFSALSSATYLINDAIDAKKDALHPIKKNRPIPSGKLSREVAILTAFILIFFFIPTSLVAVNFHFFLICVGYLLMQGTYSLWLRHVIIIDALTVAMGFILRVFAGGFATSIPVSSWIILATIGLSLLLAFGKRRSERTILTNLDISFKTRETLKHYPDSLLDSMISMSASFTIISYSFFSFQAKSRPELAIARFLPTTLSSPKWMMLTIPIVIYGVARYLYVIYEKKDAESPERVLTSDLPLLASVMVWALVALAIIYPLGTTI
ncbi:decaprenyl-phosphate phosphoribosyltransferase [Candidatus Parcubacteria bacterium]|nr:decaprenyl-phosphate phosphoribosyltransferase [Patescibacteria group bacterium]MCG2689068.1 decaprenyl-phosphate phosphoribosyltransferase [Candidatus Parcubacteria bacterium]